MKVQHDVVRSNRSCVCTSCLFRSNSQRFSVRKLHQTGPKIDKNYYGKFISLRERILLGKLFGAVYGDITQMLPVRNARDDIHAERKSWENLPLDAENIKVAKSSLIGHALKIIETDKALQSEKLSECWNSYGSIPFRENDFNFNFTHGISASSEASGCRVEAETQLGKQQAKHVNSDLCSSKFRDWERKQSEIETKKMIEKNDVTKYDHSFKIYNENKINFYKNDLKVRQTKLAGEIIPESLIKISPILHAHKIETGFQVPLENIVNGTSENFKQLFTRLKQSPVIHRPPYNFMVTPRINSDNINHTEPKIKKRIDKDAIGDTTHKTVISKVTNPYGRFSLKRCMCTLTLKPQYNKIDILMVAKAMIKLASKLSLQSKSVSGKSKQIKKSIKKIDAKKRQRSLNKSCYFVKEETKVQKQGINLSFHFNPAIEVSKEKPVNNINNLIVRKWEKANATEKGENNRNAYNVKNLPPTCGMFMNSVTNHSLRRCLCTLKLDKPHTKNCCNSREPFTSRKITWPVTKYQTCDINKASAMKEWKIDKRDISPGQCNLSYNVRSHRSLNCKPDIIGFDKLGSTCQNVIYKKTSYYECKHRNVHDEYNPRENVEIIKSHNFNIFETDHPDTNPTFINIKKPSRHVMTETVQSKKQAMKGFNEYYLIKQIPVAPKQNKAVQINSSGSFAMEFCKETSDANMYTYSRPTIDNKSQAIQNEKHNKSSETDNDFEKNAFAQSNFQNCFCTLIDKNTLNNTLKKKCTLFWKEENPRKEQGTNLESFYQDTILHRDTLNNFNLVSDVSRNKSFSFTTIRENMDTNFNKKHSAVSTAKKQQLSNNTNNMVYSRQPLSQKKGTLYAPNDKPYLIHGVSNQYRDDNSIVNLLHERPIKCKTSSSSFSSMIGATTTTTTTDSSHSFPREKYKNYKQSTSNGANNGYYKSSFYALHINVKNTRRNEKKYKLETYECEPGSCVPAPGKCNPIECDKLIKKRLMRKTSKTSTDDGTQSVSSGQAIKRSNNTDASTKRQPKYVSKQGLQYRTFPPNRSRKGAKQAVRISSSFSFNIEFSKNTAPTHDINAGREKHSGREKQAGKEQYPGKEKHLGKNRSKPSQKATAGIKHPSNKKSLRTRPTKEPKYSDACIKTCPKCLNIGTYCPCPKLQHTESQSEPETQHVGINTHSKKCLCSLKLHKSGRIYRDRAVKAKKFNIKPKVYKERGQKARAGYEPDYHTITVADKEQNKRQPMSELEQYQCEPNTCIPGECDPYVCLERIKKRRLRTKDDKQPVLSKNTEKSAKTQLRENRNDEQSSKQVTRIGSNFSFNVEFYRNRTGFDNTYKGSAAPSKKQRDRAINNNQFGGETTSVAHDTEEDRGTQNARDDVVTSNRGKAARKPRNKKNIAIMMDGDSVRDSGIQNTKEIRHQDSQINTPARHQKNTKTGALLQRCFCTAKLYGIKVPDELLQTQQEKKKSKCVLL